MLCCLPLRQRVKFYSIRNLSIQKIEIRSIHKLAVNIEESDSCKKKISFDQLSLNETRAPAENPFNVWALPGPKVLGALITCGFGGKEYPQNHGQSGGGHFP